MLALTETFRWNDGDGSQWLFNVSAINAHIDAHPEQWEPIDLGIDYDLYAHCAKNGVEQWKLDRIDAATCRPVLAAERGDGSHILIDGNHRVVARWRAGFAEIPAYMIPRTFWHPTYGWQI